MVKKLLGALVVVGLAVVPAFAQDDDTVRTDHQDFRNALDAAFFSDSQSSQAFKELNCLRSKAPAGHTFAHCSVEDRIKMLAPFLQTAFDREKMGPKERALFYSQILVESSYLTKFTETKDHTLDKCSPKKQGVPGEPVKTDTDEMALRDIISTAEDDTKFAEVRGARHSSQFGQFRGRGLIQLTRCDNYLSVIHYLNLQYRGQNPYWQPAWHTGSEQKKSNQLGAVCSEKELEQMIDFYSEKNQKKMSLNLFNVLENPMYFGSPGLDLVDKATKQSPSKTDKLQLAISGEKFMVDVAMAYWKGRCGDDVKKFIVNPKASGSQWCPKSRSGLTDNELTTLCMTGCIKGIGSTESWQKRNEWYIKAQECTK